MTIDIAEGRRLLAKATEGPCFVAVDDAHDTIPHRQSGLALVETGRDGDWPVARLCEWPTAEAIAWLMTNGPALLAALAEAEREIAALQDGYKTMMRVYEEAPGLPLEMCSPADLDRWTTALMSIGINLGAADVLFPDRRAALNPGTGEAAR